MYLKHGRWRISFRRFDDRDVDSGYGFEILYGRHYKVPWKASEKGYYWTCRKRIKVTLPYVVWPGTWFSRTEDQLNFQSGYFKNMETGRWEK